MIGLDPVPIEASRLPPALADKIVRLPDPDPVRTRFLQQHAPHGAMAMRAHGLLRRFASDFDVNAWLGTYRVCLVGRDAFDTLLRGAPRQALLDVGAGSGAVTSELAPLFSHVVTTETSRGAARGLSRRWETHAIDLATQKLPRDPRFSVVALLHVLDRAPRPRSLLEAARDRLADGGRLLIACPLPIRAHVDRGGATSDPDEWIEADGEFEPALVRLVETLLVPAGLVVERLARTTYLSQGDARQPFYALDDALVVCRRQGTGQSP
jgi:SAM-dependent methyltransferase